MAKLQKKIGMAYDWKHLNNELMRLYANLGPRKLAIESLTGDPETVRMSQSSLMRYQQEDEQLLNQILEYVRDTSSPLGGLTESKGTNMYNLSKTAEEGNPKPYEKHLRDNDKDHAIEKQDESGTVDWQLQQKDSKPGQRHRADSPIDTTEVQLEKIHKGDSNMVTDKALDEQPKLYNNKRFDKSWDTDFDHAANRVEAGHFEKRQDELKDAHEGDRDTSMWTKDVGKQMQGKKTTIVNNVQESQLQNHPERLKGIKKTQPINVSYQENLKTEGKDDKVKDMVMAQVKSADAMMFHLYARAAYENRELNKQEKQVLADVQSGKARAMQKLAQWGDPREYGDPNDFDPRDNELADARVMGNDLSVEEHNGSFYIINGLGDYAADQVCEYCKPNEAFATFEEADDLIPKPILDKKAQWDDFGGDDYGDWHEDDLEMMGNNEAWEDAQAEMNEGARGEFYAEDLGDGWYILDGTGDIYEEEPYPTEEAANAAIQKIMNPEPEPVSEVDQFDMQVEDRMSPGGGYEPDAGQAQGPIW